MIARVKALLTAESAAKIEVRAPVGVRMGATVIVTVGATAIVIVGMRCNRLDQGACTSGDGPQRCDETARQRTRCPMGRCNGCN